MLTFECNDKWVSDTMNEFVKKYYSYEFGGHLVEVDDNDNEGDVETIDVAADEEPEDEVVAAKIMEKFPTIWLITRLRWRKTLLL